MQVKIKYCGTKIDVRNRHRILLWSAGSNNQQIAASAALEGKKLCSQQIKHAHYHKQTPVDRLAAKKLSYVNVIYIGTRVILSVQFPPTEDFYSLENFKLSSDLRSFRKSENFGVSFASITLNTNMIFLKIYDTKKLLFFYKSVKLEYCENLKTI